MKKVRKDKVRIYLSYKLTQQPNTGGPKRFPSPYMLVRVKRSRLAIRFLEILVKERRPIPKNFEGVPVKDLKALPKKKGWKD